MSRVAAALSRRLSALIEARTDGQLLAAFLTDRDESAFAELVRRHGPLVWGACRRLLPDPADAEDAFQTTFLVLVQRSRRLTGQAAVGPWLYRVAAWTARNVRRRNARTLARRQPLSPAVVDPSAGPSALDLRADLDAALLALPEKYRTPLVLCHLQGWTRRDAAAAIGCPEGTLSSLLSRGLDRLRHLLRSHDPARLLTLAGAGLPAALAANTVRAAVDGKLIAAGVASSAVSQLVEGVVHMFWVKKTTAAAAALCVVFGTGIGVGVSVRPVPGLAGDGDGDGPPTKLDKFAAADLDALKAEVAAAEEVLKAAEEGVKLTREKLKLTQAAADKGQVAAAEVLQDQIALTRLEENAANARQKRAAAISRLKAAQDPAAAKRGLFEAADKPVVQPAAADLDLLRAELAAAEDALKAATEGVRLVTEKVELVRKQVERGAVSNAALLDSEIALTRFQENAANAQQKRQALLSKYRAAEAQLKDKPAAAKPAATPGQPAANTNDLARKEIETEAVLKALLARVQEMEAWEKNADRVRRDLENARKEVEWARSQLAAIRKQRAAAPPPAGQKLTDVVSYPFHLTVGGKGAEWPYRVKEYGPDGHGVGTAAFDNPAVLAKYLARVAQGPGLAKGVGVRILAPKDAPADWVKAAADAVKAAGLGAELTPLAADPAKPAAALAEYQRALQLLQLDEAKRQEQTQDQLKRALDFLGKQAEDQARQKDTEANYKKEIDALYQRIRELEGKKPADPARPPASPVNPPPRKE
ncbi:MAG: sigma-70 family RNA polymerase sigma factor [Gemmataceae bacterium]|nr:sigma-70 family RNA polymerase sigma factor [Gemmataceae bacterium]